MGKSAPAPPDPAQTIAAQSQANAQSALQTAEYNRISQYTPYGNSTFSTSGNNPDGTPIYSQTTTLAPAQQTLLDLSDKGQIALGNTANGMLGQVANSFANPLDLSKAPGIASTVSNTSTPDQIKQAQDAAYKSQAQYLDPQFSQGQDALDNNLANQGISRGSTAYQNAEDNFARQKQAAYQSAQDSAVAAGNQEQSTLFGQGVQSANLQNTAQGQYLQQQVGLQQQPLNAYNALATGSQVTNPTFSNVPQVGVGTTDAAGIINQGYQNQMAAFNAKNSGINNLMSLGGSLGGAAIMASDRRLKRDIRRVGTTPGGLALYEFRYNSDPAKSHIGVMADEVLPIHPEAVSLSDDGFYQVDYGRIK